MKVSDFLSGPTISSSRALTFYSATLVAIVWTGTPPANLPGIGHLKANNLTLYWMMLAVLSFMFVAHVVNWANDYKSDDYQRSP